LSVSSAVVRSSHIGSLIYAFTAHRDLFRSGPAAPTRRRCCRPALPDAARERDGADGDSGGDSRRRDGTALNRFGFTELFVGVIVIAIIGTRPSTTRP
jgi:hypothetical protein